jgi:hypothetical protein
VKRRKENVQEGLQLWTPRNSDRLLVKAGRSLMKGAMPTSSLQRKLEKRGVKAEWPSVEIVNTWLRSAD